MEASLTKPRKLAASWSYQVAGWRHVILLAGAEDEADRQANRFINKHNEEPRPFIWKADPHKIIAALRRGHQILESIH